MKVSKAIDILQDECCVPNSVFQQPKYQAIALGIEALKSLQQHRKLDICYACKPLPGETPEEEVTK